LALLGTIKLGRGQHAAASFAFWRAFYLSPTAENSSLILGSLQYSDEITAERLLQTHRVWDSTHAKRVASAPPLRIRPRLDAGRLRIGFMSADTGLLPLQCMVVPAIELLDKTKCSIAAYLDHVVDDERLPRFRKTAELWRITQDLSNEQLAAQIRQDEIDILVDLSGHKGNRLLVFASRPAPLQVTWFGYVGTTGLSAMDCLLADRYHVRPGEETNYVETVLRMPNGYACYEPPADAPPVGPLPAFASGYITFGSFNNPAKFSGLILDVWAEILRRIPTARLLLKYGGLDDLDVQADFRARFLQRGIESERILLEGWSPQAEHLATYGRVDLALDTQPYSGGLTTCEALWMGVPVITWPGKTFAGRHSTSHTSNSGYPEFVAADRAGYIDLAAQWASRLDELATIRLQMRDRVRQSPLCDVSRFGTDLLATLATAWNERVTADPAQRSQ
jgi:protein O-GlcNAc transferase